MEKSRVFNGTPASIGFAVGCTVLYTGDVISILKKTNNSMVLVAESLSPKQAENVNLTRFRGLILEKGGQVSHATVVARTYGIPTVVGVNLKEMPLLEGSQIIVDGFNGKVIINPDAEALNKYEMLVSCYEYTQQQFLRHKNEDAVTQDGRHIDIKANIMSLIDIEKAFSSGAKGLWMRTEMFFMDRNEPPTEEEQFQIYKTVVERAKGAPVVIRTLDVGGDKHPNYLHFPEEDNPFLGLRGLRYYEHVPEIIGAQVSAILRASHLGDIKLILPMVSRLEEIDDFMMILRGVKSDLDDRGIDYDKGIKVGAVIEVPSAAEIVSDMSQKLDFFSIGTNDLIQYLEAVDRTSEYVTESFDSYHPAVFKVISRIIDNAHSRKKLVGVCGEMASDPLATAAFLGLGVDELSMSPSYIPMIKFMVRHIRKTECTGFCNELLQAHDSKDVVRLLGMFSVKTFQFFYETRHS